MTTIAIGAAAPSFDLPDTDGARHALGGDGASPRPPPSSCSPATTAPTRSPGTTASLAVARDYADRDVRVLFINSNDAERYPRDSFEAMQQRVAGDGGWPVPYLRDEDQSVARAYGALTTPDVFVVAADGAVAYRGAPDADHGDPDQDAAWLREALDDVLEGRAGAARRDEAGRLLDQVEAVAGPGRG